MSMTIKKDEVFGKQIPSPRSDKKKRNYVNVNTGEEA
jgi:hypothetical protein